MKNLQSYTFCFIVMCDFIKSPDGMWYGFNINLDENDSKILFEVFISGW